MKNEILICARGLFNGKGIRNSTLRDIAKGLSISDGHLRYYFKTKEDLILAIFSEMDETIAAFAEGDKIADTITQTIVEAITKSFEVMYRYAFFFTESTAILEMYPKVYGAYQGLIEKRRVMFLNIFEQFRAQGIFKNEVDAELFPVLFEQFFILSDNWVKYAKMPVKSNLNEKDKIRHYVAVSIALFLPYFDSQLQEDVSIWVKKAISGS